MKESVVDTLASSSSSNPRMGRRDLGESYSVELGILALSIFEEEERALLSGGGGGGGYFVRFAGGKGIRRFCG